MASMPSPHPTALLVDDVVIASLEVASTRRARRRGLLGRDRLDGALLLPATRSVHTFGMAFDLDVALCTAELEVVTVLVLPPGRLTLPRRGVRAVVEAEAGRFSCWGVATGSRLRVG